ncbi:MAG: alginate lyase-domain-containing protein [Olpidium bornovanus]|uniref:Alginate lyase-domain-containing protein n=1 Tax=Olpidium bornovanus TaxID=278681 RepID=A0A8H7ZQ48_9FUNG|nr:MAG: alginate lyase-domain-containing protein [Olpidium bornovanus]
MHAANHHYRYGPSQHQQQVHYGKGRLVVGGGLGGGGGGGLGLANGSGRGGARRPFSFLCIAATLSVSLAFFCYTCYYYAALGPSAGGGGGGVAASDGGRRKLAAGPGGDLPAGASGEDAPGGGGTLPPPPPWMQDRAAGGRWAPLSGSGGRGDDGGLRDRYVPPPPSYINTAILRPLRPSRPVLAPDEPADDGDRDLPPPPPAEPPFAGADADSAPDEEAGVLPEDLAGGGGEPPSAGGRAASDSEDEALSPEALARFHPRTRELADHVSALGEVLVTLRRDAEIARRNDTVFSVTLKPQVPPSGDVHDYLSLARYFWPNPDTPDGLPYVKRDGHPNPEMETVHDYRMLRAVLKDVNTLGLAYFYFRDERYALKAMDRIETWFLDPKTRMNPNLNFASLTKGSKMGRRMGVLDMYPAYRMFSVLPFLAASPNWNPAILTGVREWYGEYYAWLTTSRLGILEQNGHNNHGTFWDVQALGIALFLGKREDAARIADRARKKRLEAQIRADGLQWAEAERPTSWFYSLLNLQALMLVASFADVVGVDLWHHVNATTGEGSIRAAVDYLLPHALDGGRNWPFRNTGDFDARDFVRELELAYVVYRDPKYLRAVDVLRKRDADQGKIDKSQYLCQLGILTRGNLWIC